MTKNKKLFRNIFGDLNCNVGWQFHLSLFVGVSVGGLTMLKCQENLLENFPRDRTRKLCHVNSSLSFFIKTSTNNKLFWNFYHSLTE